jgi:predicted unusual protein kinase regulating ubiquinone biosynthesis (AarF/ABC1/UbiB family)
MAIDNNGFSLGGLFNQGQRVLKLAGMTVAVAGSYAQNRLKQVLFSAPPDETGLADLYRAIGEEVAQTLGELKGAAMKVGQIASQTRGLLPPPITEALETLQKAAPPLPFKVIRKQIRSELKTAPEQLFAWIDTRPFAAASIGQVHRARTHDGREVIVKVQYPGVARSCDSDLAQLKLLLQVGRLINLKGEVLDQLFEEIRTRIHEELDYHKEAENIRCFRRFHENDAAVVIPAVVDELSTRRVLTLEYEPGDHLSEVKPPRYSQAVINQLGRRLFQTMVKQLLLLQAVHVDPHPGNFAFRPDGALVIYDFGCIKKLQPTIVRAYRDAIAAFLEGDFAALDQAMIDLGVRIEDGPPVAADYYALWRDILIRPFLAGVPFDFSVSTLHEDVVRQAPGILKRLDSFQPAADIVYINRMLGGHYWNLLQLGVKVSFFDDFQQLLESEPMSYPPAT